LHMASQWSRKDKSSPARKYVNADNDAIA
jgi:hypothetical protein